MNNTIQDKIEELVKKWQGNVPVKYSADYWRYRADQNYYLSLKRQIKTATPKDAKRLFDE